MGRCSPDADRDVGVHEERAGSVHAPHHQIFGARSPERSWEERLELTDAQTGGSSQVPNGMRVGQVLFDHRDGAHDPFVNSCREGLLFEKTPEERRQEDPGRAVAGDSKLGLRIGAEREQIVADGDAGFFELGRVRREMRHVSNQEPGLFRRAVAVDCPGPDNDAMADTDSVALALERDAHRTVQRNDDLVKRMGVRVLLEGIRANGQVPVVFHDHGRHWSGTFA